MARRLGYGALGLRKRGEVDQERPAALGHPQRWTELWDHGWGRV